MKLARLIDSRFQNSLNKLSKQDVPVTVAFKMKGINKRIQEELSKYDEVRLETINKYALRKEDDTLELDENNNAKFSQENFVKFAQDMGELASTEVSIPTIKLSELQNITMSMDDMVILEDIITED